LNANSYRIIQAQNLNLLIIILHFIEFVSGVKRMDVTMQSTQFTLVGGRQYYDNLFKNKAV